MDAFEAYTLGQLPKKYCISFSLRDGREYYHQEEQVEISCSDCHFNGKPETVTFAEMDEVSWKVMILRKMNIVNRRFLITQKTRRPLINVFQNKDPKR